MTLGIPTLERSEDEAAGFVTEMEEGAAEVVVVVVVVGEVVEVWSAGFVVLSMDSVCLREEVRDFQGQCTILFFWGELENKFKKEIKTRKEKQGNFQEECSLFKVAASVVVIRGYCSIQKQQCNICKK